MTQMEDPDEILRLSMEGFKPPAEDSPPSIKRAEVWPYPELDRLWVRVEVTPFAAYPNLEMIALDPDGAVVSTMFMVEIRETYQSITMHLRQAPRPHEPYMLVIELTREDQTLDRRELPFDLIFRDPKESRT